MASIRRVHSIDIISFFSFLDIGNRNSPQSNTTAWLTENNGCLFDFKLLKKAFSKESVNFQGWSYLSLSNVKQSQHLVINLSKHRKCKCWTLNMVDTFKKKTIISLPNFTGHILVCLWRAKQRLAFNLKLWNFFWTLFKESAWKSNWLFPAFIFLLHIGAFCDKDRWFCAHFGTLLHIYFQCSETF